MKKVTVTVGIPAYNEDQNIKKLIKSIMVQDKSNFMLDQIIVVLDGCTDKTEEIIDNLNSKKIKKIVIPKRQGQQSAQNKILEASLSDILIILEADTILAHRTTLKKLVKPFANEEDVEMVVGEPLICAPENFYEKTLYYGYKMKFDLFRNWKGGSNLYSCGGHSMKAFSRKLAHVLVWPNKVPEDAYTYMTLVTHNMKMKKVPGAKSYMCNVKHMSDRIRQVNKFKGGKAEIYKNFGKNLAKNEYTIPKGLLIKTVWKHFKKQPFWISMYFLEVVINRILTIKKVDFNEKYVPYLSSKHIHKI